MAAANIDAVERYVKRIEEYTDEKLCQTKMYKPTVKRIFKLRNLLLKVCEKLDKVIEQFGYQIDEVDSTCNLTEDNSEIDCIQDEVVSTCTSQNDIEIDLTKLESIISDILDAKLAQSGIISSEPTPCISSTDSDNTTEPNKDTSKSVNNKKIISAYKQMFDDSKQLDHDSEIIQRTITFLRDWFDTKILGFYKLRKVNPKLTYNITWLPKWIRDYIIYIGSNSDNIEEAFDKLEDFLSADSNDSRYTYIVPYEVAELGRNADRLTVTDVSSAIWGELFNYVFKNLAIPNDNSCYCSESLIDYAYLTDKQIENFVDSATLEYYKTVEWVMKFKFKL